jgi:O-antigen/teichoic acid export membrane protein
VHTTRPTAVAAIVATGLIIALNQLLVPRLGKEGTAWATLLSQAFVPAYIFNRGQKLYPIPYRFTPAIAMLILAGTIVAAGEILASEPRSFQSVDQFVKFPACPRNHSVVEAKRRWHLLAAEPFV